MVGFLYVCHHCQQPTFFQPNAEQHPGTGFGNAVGGIESEEVEALYQEARDCLKVNAATASILCSRKLLMNIAVSKGADEGKSFAEYVDYLAENNFVPPDSREWINHIREKGNEAAHEIAIMDRADAEELITFLEMLLKFIFEFPATIKSKVEAEPAEES